MVGAVVGPADGTRIVAGTADSIPEGITDGFLVGAAVGVKLGDIIGVADDTKVG